MTLISVMSCIAVMAVGVYAATKNFSVQVNNRVSVEISQVDGELYGKRFGDVIFGDKSMGDEGFEQLGTTYDEMNATTDYLHLYGYQDGLGRQEYSSEMDKIETPVNFYATAKESLTINYVFKFEFENSSETNVIIALTNSSTQLTDSRKNKISMSYKYFFGATEPTNWKTSGTSLGVDNGGTASIKVLKSNTSTHVVYIYASMTVTRTNTLEDAYTLGMGGEDFRWRFSLAFTSEHI